MLTRRLHAPEFQAVTFVELFFDLVFVFAVTQVTKLTVSDLTFGGVARSVLLFWLVWWAWTQFTWTLNPADTEHSLVRAITLVASAVAFVMAVSVTRAFGADVWWFAGPYLCVRAIGLGLQVRIDLERAETRNLSMAGWVGLSLVGLALVGTGALVPVPARYWIWGAAIVVDLVAASRGGATGQEWDIAPAHFSERHGLFVIIAIGESLIVAATVATDATRTAALVGVVAAALAITCLLWWTYFGWLKESIEEGLCASAPARVGTVARDAYSLGHFPLICGIIGFAVAVEKIILHPDEVPDGAVVASLGIGVGLFVGATAFAAWRAAGIVLRWRLVILGVTLVGLAMVSSWEPVWQLNVVGAGVFAVVVVEQRAVARRRVGAS